MIQDQIPFNKPYITGKEFEYIQQAIVASKLSGNGLFTQRCQKFFESKYGFRKCLLTTSCTDALEMAAILIDIKQGDEVIMPSFTFVSTANAFVLRGARIIFADSRSDHPGLDESKIESLITKKTKAIIVVHYAGIACDMDIILAIAEKHGLFVIEDAAQAIDSYYKGKPLGGLGHFSAFSFHETKNIISGEGGMLVVNDERFVARSEIIWEKGTNRSAFFRGTVDKYGWVDLGSSFLPSEIIAAFLWAQLEEINSIQSTRKNLWNKYFSGLFDAVESGLICVQKVPAFASNNAHMFYILCKDLTERTNLVNYLKAKGIHAVFHYQSLHSSPYYADKHDGRVLTNSDIYTNTLLRLPFYGDLSSSALSYVVGAINEFYKEYDRG